MNCERCGKEECKCCSFCRWKKVGYNVFSCADCKRQLAVDQE